MSLLMKVTCDPGATVMLFGLTPREVIVKTFGCWLPGSGVDGVEPPPQAAQTRAEAAISASAAAA